MTKSSWEELEEWSKEDLIIELVHMRTLYSRLRERSIDGDDFDFPYVEYKGTLADNGTFWPGETAPDHWAEKIVLRGAMNPKDSAIYSCDLMDYGLTEDQADKVFERLYTEGRLKVPDGIEIVTEDDYKEGD